MVKLFESFRNESVNLDLPKIVNWYTCGPTIYDDSHIGHARTFITYDILRKYLESIGHHVLYTMNITDIDDKIMTKVRKLHWNNLLEKVDSSHGDTKLDDENTEKKLSKLFTEDEMTPPMNLFYDFVDKEEQKFWDDMRSIKVKMPFAKIRVTQVHNDIIEFIEKLINNDMAYISNGSVYFDTQKYKDTYNPPLSLHSDSHDDMNLKNNFTTEKRHPHDFSLWKAKKKYEISFNSPWGQGHVSWHTECSAMINKLFGDKPLHIHSGGIDLKFPHHHNECVQTIAHNGGNMDWVKYFVHTGHLHVDNEKMSKSLGNSVTIKNFLTNYNYRVLRLAFMVGGKWNDILNFNETLISYAADVDKRLSNFYENVAHHINLDKSKTLISDEDLKFITYIDEAETNLENLWELFDLQKILLEVQKIIDRTYLYMSYTNYSTTNLIKVKNLLDKQIVILGLDYDTKEAGNSDKYINAIVDIRTTLKKYACDIPKENNEIKKKIFNLSDWIRDVKMKEIGIKMEDLKDSTKWTLM